MADVTERLRAEALYRDNSFAGSKLMREAADEIDRLRADVAQLRDALSRCPPDRPQMTGDEFRDAVNTWWRLWARPALNATELQRRRMPNV